MIRIFRNWYFIFFGRVNHVRNYKRANKIKSVICSFEGPFKEARQICYLRKINPYSFEELLLNCFYDLGYDVIRNRSYSNDGGLDGECISPTGERFLIQAKRYSDHIKLSDVIKFKELVQVANCRGFFIHTGKTGMSVKHIISDTAVNIISGDRLLKLITSNQLY